MLDATATALMLMVLGWIYYGPWQDLCTDMTRQVLFAKRGRLFDFAADGKLSFDAQNYRTIRTYMEHSIRYAHELTIWKHLRARILLSRMGQLNRETPLDRAIASIEDQETREQVKLLIRDGNLSLLAMAIVKSPILLLVTVPVIGAITIYAIVTSQIGKVKAELVKEARGLEAEAQYA